MSSLIKSDSLLPLGLGALIGVFAIVLVLLEQYEPSPLTTFAIVLLTLVIAAQGLKPFGETVGYQILQALVFAFVGVAEVATGELNTLAVVFILVGCAGFLYYGSQARRRGVWESVSS